MSRARVFAAFLLAAVAFAPVAPARAVVNPFTGPKDVLAAGPLKVDVMELVAPPRAIELGSRLRAAVQQNQAWFQEQVRASKPGAPLPYDARLGLSREEYAEFLSIAKKWTLTRKEQATVQVTKRPGDVYVLDGGPTLHDLTGIEIDLGKNQVRTPFGVAAERTAIDAHSESPLGPWKGAQWMLRNVNVSNQTGTVATFAVGIQTSTGRGVIDYDVKSVTGQGKTRIMRILTFQRPARGAR